MSKTKSGDATRIGALRSWLQQREDEMAALLAELVSIPTENPPGKNYRACADLLERRVRDFGLDCERLEAGDSKEATSDSPICLIATYGRENAFSTFTDITMWFPRSRGSNSSLCVKTISCLAAAPAT